MNTEKQIRLPQTRNISHVRAVFCRCADGLSGVTVSIAVHLFAFLILFFSSNRNAISERFIIDARSGHAPATVTVSVIAPESPASNTPAEEAVSETGVKASTASAGDLDPGLLAGEVSRLNRSIEYPALARKMELEGLVQILITTDATGHVSKAAIHVSSGHELLDRAAMNSLLAWTFSIHGRTFLIPVRFMME